MKEMMNGFISNLHYIILLYGLYGVWTKYDEHSILLEEITTRSNSLDEEIRQSQKKVRDLKEFAKKKEEYKVRVNEVAKSIEAVQRQLPADTNDSQILDFLRGEMGSLKIQNSNITPGPESKSTYYISKEFSLKADGTFLQFLIFLERIGNADRIYNIKEIKFTAPAENSKGRFKIINVEGILEAFRFNPDFKVERGFE
jgi:Tfp pilus assembly protein PilO